MGSEGSEKRTLKIKEDSTPKLGVLLLLID